MAKSKMTDSEKLDFLISRFDGLEKKVSANHNFLQANAKRTSDIDRKLDKHISETNQNFKKVNNRLDMIGTSVAYLEDDTPTREEFDKLERKVAKLI